MIEKDECGEACAKDNEIWMDEELKELRNRLSELSKKSGSTWLNVNDLNFRDFMQLSADLGNFSFMAYGKSVNFNGMEVVFSAMQRGLARGFVIGLAIGIVVTFGVVWIF